MTQNEELAKEWAAKENSSIGYVNEYAIDLKGLKILDSDGKECGILNWVAILVQNRVLF